MGGSAVLNLSIIKCILQGGGEGSSSYQSIILTSGDMGVVEEEVTTEIIKSEIQVDDDSSHFQIKNESVEYENGLDMKKVIVTKVN